jgi:endonuclease YncB( thermonuclease family)/mannose-6-phosphate isomerase-like protein (cupin superfamily)
MAEPFAESDDDDDRSSVKSFESNDDRSSLKSFESNDGSDADSMEEEEVPQLRQRKDHRPSIEEQMKQAEDNTSFRQVLYTQRDYQSTAMAVSDFIGAERHDARQDFLVMAGRAVVVVGDRKFVAGPGDSWEVAPNELHNVARFSLSNEDPSLLKLFTVYDRPLHHANEVHKTRADAEAAERKENLMLTQQLGQQLLGLSLDDSVAILRQARLAARRMQRFNEHLVEAQLVRVIDADTIVVNTLSKDGSEIFQEDVHVRLLGIDTPEISHSRGASLADDNDDAQPARGQAYGQMAKHFVELLMYGKPFAEVLPGEPAPRLVLRSIGKERKTHGRMVASVFVKRPTRRGLPTKLIDVQEEVLRAGLGWHYKKYDRSVKLAEAEQEARRARRNLWSQDSPQPPWEWRAERRANAKRRSSRRRGNRRSGSPSAAGV